MSIRDWANRIWHVVGQLLTVKELVSIFGWGPQISAAVVALVTLLLGSWWQGWDPMLVWLAALGAGFVAATIYCLVAIATKIRRALRTGSMPLAVTLGGFFFSNYPGMVPDGAAVVSATVPGGQSRTETGESIDDQVFALSASITNLSEKRLILNMRLVLTRKDGRQIKIDAGRRGQWGLLMGEHDAASVLCKTKNMPMPKYFDFPLTIEPHSNVDGRVSFISFFPRDILLKEWMFGVTKSVEITDALSGKTMEMPTSGTYRGT
jgi:hypothetical protein